MSNISEFRAMHGTDINRIDVRTPEGIQSLYGVIVLSEKRRSILVQATVTQGDGGYLTEQRVRLSDVVEVFE
jgi:hypothetical protein